MIIKKKPYPVHIVLNKIRINNELIIKKYNNLN